MPIRVANTHLIHSPRSEGGRLDNVGSALSPRLMKSIDLGCQFDVEMKPHTRLTLRLPDKNELDFVQSHQCSPNFGGLVVFF